MSQKSSPIDLLNRLSSSAGWSADRSRLSEEELSGLAEMIEPAMNAEGRQRFGIFVQNIFGSAVEGLLTQWKYDASPAVAFREEASRFLETMESAQNAIDGLDEGLRPLLDCELATLANAQNAPRTLPTTSIELWRKETSDLIAVVVAASRRLEIAPVKGESRAVYRQMVRGLLALVFHSTGVLPKRSTARRHAGESSKEDYWFLYFAQRMAEFVATRAAAVEERRMKVDIPPTTKTIPSRKPRKIVGAPPLSSVVREELQAFRLELTGRTPRRPAGETNRPRRR